MPLSVLRPLTRRGFLLPLIHRFDPLDYEALEGSAMRKKVASFSDALRYPTSTLPGFFKDQSAPRIPGLLLFATMAVFVAAPAYISTSFVFAVDAIGRAWNALLAATAGTYVFFRAVGYIAGPTLSPRTALAVAAIGAGLLGLSVNAQAAAQTRPIVITAALLLVAVASAAVAEHVRVHLQAFTPETSAEPSDPLSKPIPYLALLGAIPFLAANPKDALLPLLTLPWIFAFLIAYRALERHRVPFRSPLHMLRVIANSWIYYGTRGGHAPGVLRSPAGPPSVRLLTSLLLLLFLAGALSPFPYIGIRPSDLHVPSPWAIASFCAEWLGAALVPLTLLGSTTLALVASMATDFEHVPPLPEHQLEPVLNDSDRWNLVMERLALSDQRISQFLIGFHATEHYPVFLPADLLRRHASIVGATSAGKTSRVLLPLVAQILSRDDDDEFADGTRQGPLVVIDLKGERYFFNAVRRAAEEAGRPFRYFSNHPDRGTFAFNPVLDLRELGIPIQQVAATIHAALNLEHGTGYGAGYFSSVTRNYLASLLDLAPDAESVAEIFAARDKLRQLYPHDRERREIEREASELISSLQQLSRRPELNVTARSKGDPAWFASRISMHGAFKDNAVIYFNLFSKAEETATRFIGSLALECLYAATYRHNEDPPSGAVIPKRQQVFAIVDEFQRISGRNFGVFLEQARSAGLSLILAKQSESVVDAELQDALDTNPAYRHYFTFRNTGAMTNAQETFGDTAYGSPDAVDAEIATTLGPRFHTNDLRALSALDGYAACVFEADRDFSRFQGQGLAVYSPYHVTPKQHQKIADDPFPVGEPGTLTVGEKRPTISTPSRQPEAPPIPSPPLEGTALAGRFARIRPSHDGYAIDETQ